MNDDTLDELLPFYVNGTLPAAERERVEAYLKAHPEAQAEVQWLRSLQARVREEAPAVSAEVGLDRALQRIRAEGRAQPGARPAAQPGALARLRGWLASLVPQSALRPALGGALALAVVQGAVIVQLLGQHEDDSTELRALRGGAVVEQGPYLKLNFKPDARESDIRMLLVGVNGSLAAGPGQLGDYYVRVPAQQIAQLTAQLQASPIVDGVQVVDGLPARQ
ncbi:anti-sigma factor family protein [Azohydromonas aeria]|uniref:anti-sigma factor family protein n=1 Tax=Azohydromonas aeria TaxID=2590212 RepID=UPI0012F8AFA0|nr:hypothetical protein [Azohydromonas aeria]